MLSVSIERKPFGGEVRERAGVLFQRGEAVRIPIDIIAEPDFALRAGCFAELLADIRQPLLADLRLAVILLPVDRVGIVLFGPVDGRLELLLQRHDRSRRFQFRMDEQGAEKPHDGHGHEHAPDDEDAAQPRPPLAVRVLKYECTAIWPLMGGAFYA